MQPIYLDNNATTRVADEVVAAMTPYYSDLYGNAHALHVLGRSAHDAVEAARDSVAAMIDCDPGEIIFTSCGTEANALAIRGLLDTRPARRQIVTTAVEHPSVLTMLRALASRGDIELAVVPVASDGAVNVDVLRELVSERTLLVSIMLAQNETGVIHPVRAIADIAHKHGALVHVDAIQAAGKIAASTTDLGADFLTISGHKFHAPKGIGALMVRRGVVIAPLWYGGGQELGLRSGTEAVPAIVGLGVAAGLAVERLPQMNRVRVLRDRLESEIIGAAREVTVNCASQPRLPNTACVSFHGNAGDEIVRALDERGVCVTSGAACHAGSIEPSPTMRAMNLPLRAAMGAVRFSLSRYTTENEIERAIQAVASVGAGFSPHTAG
jgi:cysteine desulfurase